MSWRFRSPISFGSSLLAAPALAQMPTPTDDDVVELSAFNAAAESEDRYRAADAISAVRVRARNVLQRDFTLLHGGHFGILATGVANLTIDHLLIDTNRDGIDIMPARTANGARTRDGLSGALSVWDHAVLGPVCPSRIESSATQS